jgi:predicted negative regulator of RcsB-dependent stress response
MATQKKDAKEPDEFLEALRRGYQYFLDNVKLISIIAGGILAGIVIILFVLYQVRESRIREAAALDNAVSSYHEGNLDAALTSLKVFAKKEDVSAARAELYSGNILYDQGKFEDSLKHFEKALSIAQTKEIEVLQDMAREGIAYVELAMGHMDKAEEAFQGLGEQFKDLSLLELARIYSAQGKNKKAVSMLDDLINNYSASPWVPAAKKLKERISQ